MDPTARSRPSRETWTPDHVVITDRPERPRTRRASDVVKLLASLSGVALVVVAGSVQSETTVGIQQDISSAVRSLPDVLVGVLATLSSVAFLALPVYLLVDLTFRRRWRLLWLTALSGGIALLVSSVVNNWAETIMGERLFAVLAEPVGAGGAVTTVTFGIFASAVALLTAQGQEIRVNTAAVVWTVLAGLGLLYLVDGRATLFALLISIFGGQAVAFLVRYVFGTENPRLPTIDIAEALARVGTPPLSMERLDHDVVDGRQYSADLLDRTGRETTALVTVMDPDRGTARVLNQLRRMVRVRGWVTRAPSFSPRLQIQQAAVPVLMAREAGVRTPRTLAAAQVHGPTLVIAEERPQDLRLLEDFAPTAISDAAIEQAWQQMRMMHHAGVSHEGITTSSFAVDRDGRVWLLDLAKGEIAASRLRMRLDRAELLLATSFLVGIERAVAVARRVIGAREVADLPSLIQPVALNQANRQLIKSNRGHLDRLVEEIAEQTDEPAQGAVRLERLRPRTVVSIVAATFAVYVLAGQLSDINFSAIFSEVSWFWAITATVASLLTYVGTALAIAPLSPVRLSPTRWLSAQFASEFVRLVAPAAVGSAGTNARVIQKAGVPASLALATVGVATVITFITTVVAFAGVTLSSSADIGLRFQTPSAQVWTIVGVLALVIATAFVVPITRRMIINRIKPTWADFGPRFLEAVRNPKRIAVAVSGTLIMSLSYAVTLYASVRAYGEDIPIAAAAAVYLGAGLLGTVAPTPGGIGAVEAALVAGLSAVGVGSGTALLAALLYRLVTFWLPALPGWLSFQYLQNRNAI